MLSFRQGILHPQIQVCVGRSRYTSNTSLTLHVRERHPLIVFFITKDYWSFIGSVHPFVDESTNHFLLTSLTHKPHDSDLISVLKIAYNIRVDMYLFPTRVKVWPTMSKTQESMSPAVVQPIERGVLSI